MNPKISIIVPVYNAQDYLEKCLDSILNQTFTDFEVILVDDGSKDNSSIICDEYAMKDSRIKVIHQVNKGVSHARNRGLDISKGEYIGFVDPDDYIDCHMYKRLYDIILEESADISWCGYRRIYKKERYISATTNKVTIFNRIQVLEGYFNKRKPFDNMFLWDKLYKKEIFYSVRLNEKLTIQEDEEVLLRILNQSNKVVYIDIPFYNYMIRDTGASRDKNLTYYHSLLTTIQEIYSFTLKNLTKYSDYVLVSYIECIFNTIVVFLEHDYQKSEYMRLRTELKKLFKNIMRNRRISLKYKIHSICVIFTPIFYSMYIKLRLKKISSVIN